MRTVPAWTFMACERPRLQAFSVVLSVASGFALCGCDFRRSTARVADSEELTVAMPLASDTADAVDVSLIAQPQQPRREIIPTPAGQAEVRGELIKTPVGEPETVSVKPPSRDAATDGMAATQPEVGAVDASKVSAPEPATVMGQGGPEEWQTWPTPQTVLFVTGNQHGYIEPCGCTGLENQKGGLARRFTLLKQLSDRGWPIVPLDAGNQVRRTGRQAEIKFQAAISGLVEMDYAAVGFGPEDLRLGVGELIAVAAVDDPAQARFVSANVTLIDPSLMPQSKVVSSGGRRIGVTSVLDPKTIEGGLSDEIQIESVDAKLAAALHELKGQGSEFNVLLYFGDEDAAAAVVRRIPDIDLVVVGGGYGEPTYQAVPVDGAKTKMIVTGNKGMYVGLVGLYSDSSIRYARVALTHEFEDAPEMRRLMASYQNQLQALGLDGLGLKPIAHPSGDKFLGTENCGECHTTAYQIWQNTPHALATEHIVHPGERSDVSRHFDPECLSCHVTGWNPQNYYPYLTGYLSLDGSAHLTGNGCENCHGPGGKHAAAEREDSGVAAAERDALRVAMRLPLDSARERCMECHDLDNSPDFHKEGAFEDYWAEVEHYGVD